MTFATFAYIGYVAPYIAIKDNINEIFNEICVTLCIYIIMVLMMSSDLEFHQAMTIAFIIIVAVNILTAVI